ncbi:MAG: IS1380 family transposase [Gammaproteobacteria bacterium]
MQTAATGTVAHAGVVLPRLLGDRVGLTHGLSAALARPGFLPGRDRGRALVDAVAAMACGASCLSDIEAMTGQAELFGAGGGASDSTLLRILTEYGERLGPDGLPGARLARELAGARAVAWAVIVDRHGDLPAVKVAGTDLNRRRVAADGAVTFTPITVLRIDAMLIEADSAKEKAAGNYKGGFGFHPMSSTCSNVGDYLATMNRPGNAGSFTAIDQVAVLDHGLAQIPARWRTDVLVTIDGAGASHEIIDHLHALNTAREHGKRGRRVEYSIKWPMDARTRAGIESLRENDWTDALTAEGKIDPHAQVAEVTGLLREGPGGDRLDKWPTDMRVLARRVERAPGEQAPLDEDPTWRYGAWVTNTVGGQTQFLDARHRTQAHIEDNNKDLKACGGANLPSKDYTRNSAWLQLAALAVTLLAWLRHAALDGELAKAAPKTLRYRLFAVPARLITHARRRVLKVAETWPWATDLTTAWDRLQALHPA